MLELVVVIIIISIMTTLATTHYSVYREKALDKDVQASLNLIIAAERIYRMERNNYYVSANDADLNTNLRLYLATNNMQWDYLTSANNALVPPKCCAQAVRVNLPGNNRTWRLCTTDNAPIAGGTCGVNAGNCP